MCSGADNGAAVRSLFRTAVNSWLGISFRLCVHFDQDFLAGALDMLLNDAVGLGEIPRPQGIEHHLMVAGGALLLHPGVAGQQIVGHQ